MMKKDDYQKCLETIYALGRFGIILGLSTIKNVLNGLGNPQDRFSCIHIAGTNGKGSIASALSSILTLSGYKTGLYTSPHLVSFNERICINNVPVSDERVVEAYEAVKRVDHGERRLTFFEYATAMAFYEFGKQEVDWAVIETGMGGRFDATNIVKPEISIITNISIEHKTYLGNTIKEISGEKAGIIKQHTPVVTGAKQASALTVIKEKALEKNASVYCFGKDFSVRRNKNKGTFTYSGIQNTYTKMQTCLSGNYQVDNAALVLAACEVLNKRNKAILPEESIREGIIKNNWPGRLEIVSTSPLIILDGAHNLAAAKNLATYLAEKMTGRQIILVAGILDDKPYEAMLRSLLPVCSKVILARADNERSLDPEKLKTVAEGMVPDILVIPEVADAIKYAIEMADTDDVICIAGSLYVVGEAKAFFKKQQVNPSCRNKTI